MLILVHIDLSGADLALFEDYERAALALLPLHGARVEERLRAADGQSEVHLLYFPDPAALDAFRADPRRAALQHLWQSAGATSALCMVERLEHDA